MRRFMLAVLLAPTLLAAPAAAQDLQGHGGPVSALAVEGAAVLSGSFDTRAIVWDGESAVARLVLRFHDGSVTATAFLPDGGFATAGQDGRIALWDEDAREPRFTTALHQGPVAELAVSPDGTVLAAASWDGRIQLVDLTANEARLVDAHQGMVTGIAYRADGDLLSIGSDLRLVTWRDGESAHTLGLPDSPNGLAVLDTGVAVIFADGALRVFDGDGMSGERQLSQRPLVSIASSNGVLAAAAVTGEVWLLDAGNLASRHAILPEQGAIWSLAITGDDLLTGGADGLIRRWDLTTGAPRGSGEAPTEIAFDDGSRGAEVWRSCALCHALTPDDGNRAGPTMHGIFGRRIGTAEGYDYSQALREMDIVWTPRTVAELFEYGPEAYTPGTRMPEQRIPSDDDREALVEFLARMTE
ncbi:MAG: monoheme cytochrome c [Saliniramus fredricksonii]|uniref:Monoheme cytochrome c n=1 Tax=Saliniramus fredricksonii TaxID=1653334 RepID=A0A0P7Y6H1_9HYPH|nr:c-type cytochrome [Saliniramus fredricksonii]KPQ09845.1 MAG: monoheme cytochrome c [Saliniramus fredricksonii]SCC82162.1 WD-40 repeat-containing protein [Saliniramus fredricksonii]